MQDQLGVKEVFLIRHGETNANSTKTHMGADSALTSTGIDQSHIAALRVARIPNLGAIISSNSPRSLETAQIIHNRTGIAIEESSLFVSRRRPSILDGKSQSDPLAKQIMAEIFEGYLIPGHRHSDEENLDDLKERAKQALDFLIDQPAQKICVITHGSFLWVLFCAVFAGPDFSGTYLQRAIQALGPDNAGITRFVYGRLYNPISNIDTVLWRVKSWSDIAHLDEDLWKPM